MVDSKILIDTTFLFDMTHKAFLGAELFQRDGTDVTYAFGFLRDVLRLRQKLEIRRALLVIGKEAYAAAPQEKVKSIVVLLDELGLPTLYEPKLRVLDIGNSLSGNMTHVLSHDNNLLQLVNGSLRMLLPNSSNGYVEVTVNDVKPYLGVTALEVPTFLTLTEGPKAAQMTKRQSTRLIEMYGDLDQLYVNLEQVKSSQLRAKLAEHEKRLRTIYAELQLKATKIRPRLPNLSLKLDNPKTRQVLRSYQFHSLTRMLSLNRSTTVPRSVMTTFGTNGKKPRPDYHVVVDRAGLQQLEAVIRAEEHCAVDTESDDKDPHRATLFGVALSVSKGTAYFVPLLEKNLKGISPEDVTKSLRKILGGDIKLIGHNFKYDYVLLRRHNVRVKTVHFDTMLAAYNCYGDWEFFNLPYLADKLLNRKIKSYKEVVGKDQTFLELPFREIVHHACEDADVAFQLFRFFQKELEIRVIADQFFAETMPLLCELGELEFRGVSASSKQLEKIRQRLAEDATQLKELAFKEIGTSFDLDSKKALELLVCDSLNLRSVIGANNINTAMLEQLAIGNELLQLIVKYRRVKKRMSAVEAVIKCVDRNRVYPVFSQIRAKHGGLSSKYPNLFDIENVYGLADSFGKEIRGYFRCPMESLDTLQEAAGDEIIQNDRASNDRENAFLATHTVTNKLESAERDELLLNLVIGRSDFEVSKRFLVDRMSASMIRHDIEVRYRTLFMFLDKFRSESAARGYACMNGKRKYLAGLKSSNLSKRQKAQEYAVRWLLQW